MGSQDPLRSPGSRVCQAHELLRSGWGPFQRFDCPAGATALYRYLTVATGRLIISVCFTVPWCAILSFCHQWNFKCEGTIQPAFLSKFRPNPSRFLVKLYSLQWQKSEKAGRGTMNSSFYNGQIWTYCRFKTRATVVLIFQPHPSLKPFFSTTLH